MAPTRRGSAERSAVGAVAVGSERRALEARQLGKRSYAFGIDVSWWTLCRTVRIAGELPLIHFEVFVNEECTAAVGAIDERNFFPTEVSLDEHAQLKLAGSTAAKRWHLVPTTRVHVKELETQTVATDRRIRAIISTAVVDARSGWIADNLPLIRTARKEIRAFTAGLREHPSIADNTGRALPRVCVVAEAYLQASNAEWTEPRLLSFLEGLQEAQELEMGELWALKPALQLALLERIANGDETTGEKYATSLRQIADAQWNELFESANIVDRVLARDPAATYTAMEFESRDLYRKEIADFAKHSPYSERAVAEAAIGLAESHLQRDQEGRAAERRSHVGFYLLDAGAKQLRAAVAYKPPFARKIRDAVLADADTYYIVAIEIATFLIIAGLLHGLDTLTPIISAFFLLVLPASQAAVEFANSIMNFLIPPRILPKLDFSEGIPEEYSAIVAVPTLLLNEEQVRELVTDLEIRYLANPDPQLYFALLTDAPDSDGQVDERDDLVEICRELITSLNQRYGDKGRSPFFLFHRYRLFNPCEGRWMGWERKRGKLLDLNDAMRGQLDRFPIRVGDTGVLPNIRYIITLDSDTQLPRDSARRLLGTMAHPLNRAVIHPQSNIVVEGYGILQPRIGISVQSASRSRLASLYSGQTGFDIYTRAVSDVYQDLFGEGSFTGKGIYEVDTLRSVLNERFPDNTLLSHDLIEGAYTRAGLVSDIELIDDYPSHFSAYSRRKHRWVRGDWQIVRWLLNKVPDYRGQPVRNPITLVSQWKILDNLRRSLTDPGTLALVLAGWFYLPAGPAYWTGVMAAMLVMPLYMNLLLSVVRAPWGQPGLRARLRDTIGTFVRGHASVVIQVVFLLHQALLSIDAIVRSLARSFLTKRKLLEWETAAEAEAMRRRKSTVDVYLELSPVIVAGIAGLLFFLRAEALPFAAPWLILWFAARWISAWLNKGPRKAERSACANDVELLRTSAVRTWRYFREWSAAETNHLIPDNVTEIGATADRVSPTNLGFLLNARIAAVELGYMTVPEFAAATAATLGTLERLQTFRGHFLNWYDTRTLASLEPRFVSTVDSGNLAACLWTLKHAAVSYMAQAPRVDVLWSGLRDISRVIAEAGGPAASHIEEFVRRHTPDWNAVPQLAEMARDYANSASGEAAWWAAELVVRIERARAWIAQGLSMSDSAALQHVVQAADSLVRDMDFTFLYNKRKKVLSVGYDVDARRLEPSTYDLLASESRIAAFVAIAKGDIPQESWFHLGRQHVLAHGRRVLISWTGTMFEYLMPRLWIRDHRDTIMRQSMYGAVALQRRAARKHDVPWGMSESGFIEEHAAGGYGYRAFGLPEVSQRPSSPEVLVISPYSTFLAASVDARAGLGNLRHMMRLGWTGRYGFYEAVDYTAGEASIVRSWMAHHQGMILLSVCNMLVGNAIQNYFHAEPHVLATELLLDERVPKTIMADAENVGSSLKAAA